jgi:hypothetical protein
MGHPFMQGAQASGSTFALHGGTPPEIASHANARLIPYSDEDSQPECLSQRNRVKAADESPFVDPPHPIALINLVLLLYIWRACC